MFINADKDKNPSSRSIMTSRQPQRFIYRLLITFHYVRSKCLIQCCMTAATNNKYIQLYLNSIFFLPFDALSLILRCPSCCQKRWPFVCHSLAVKGQIGACPSESCCVSNKRTNRYCSCSNDELLQHHRIKTHKVNSQGSQLDLD